MGYPVGVDAACLGVCKDGYVVCHVALGDQSESGFRFYAVNVEVKSLRLMCLEGHGAKLHNNRLLRAKM